MNDEVVSKFLVVCLLLFSPYIFVPTCAAGGDCDLSDGYIRDHRDNATDNCDQECGWMQCGDVCINVGSGNLCNCGEERLILYEQIPTQP